MSAFVHLVEFFRPLLAFKMLYVPGVPFYVALIIEQSFSVMLLQGNSYLKVFIIEFKTVIIAKGFPLDV